MSWRSRNLPWLVALVPTLALTSFAASQRMLTIYLPWEDSRPHQAIGKTEFHQQFTVEDRQFERNVTVELLRVMPVAELDGKQAAAGAQLWQADLSFEADPGQLLSGCQITLRAGEVSYSASAGQVAIPGETHYNTTTNCVPLDTPGPYIDYFSDLQITEDTPPRPTHWEVAVGFALPVGVTPSELRISWNPPDYLVFPINP